MSVLSFTGKVVLVTGACSTVGSELAKYFSKLGASLVLTDSDKYRLNIVGEECSGSPVLKIAADLTKDEDVSSVIKQAIAEFKKLDVLINYVGPTDGLMTDDQPTLSAFKLMMSVSVCSVYCLTQLAYPHLVKTKGNVVIVNDLVSPLKSNVTSCNVSRSALDELTRSLASEFLCKDVRVNAVSAGSVDKEPNSSRKSSEKSAALRTHLGPEDIAAAVVFLASDLAHFVIGANLPVDGGKHLSSINENPDSAAEMSHGKITNASRSNVPKTEQTQPDSNKKEQSHVDGSADENSKKIEQAKQASVRPDSRKSESDKSTAAKHQSAEKMGITKLAAKSNN